MIQKIMNKSFSLIMAVGILFIPFLSISNNINFINKLKNKVGDYNLAHKELIPNVMFENPVGLYYYTEMFNSYLFENPNYTLEIQPSYLNDLPKIYDEYGNVIGFDGWYLFSIEMIDQEEYQTNGIIVWRQEVLDWWEDFFVWSYNERLDYDTLYQTPELTEDDYVYKYGYYYILFDGTGNWTGGVGFEPKNWDYGNMGWNYLGPSNDWFYYFPPLFNRMLKPIEKQSFNIYDSYTAEEINENVNEWFGDRIYIIEFEKYFHEALNWKFIEIYGVDSLDHNRFDATKWNTSEDWMELGFYVVEDIREDDYELSYYDENGNPVETETDGSNGKEYIDWEYYETIYVKVEFTNNIYYLTLYNEDLVYYSYYYIDLSTTPEEGYYYIELTYSDDYYVAPPEENTNDENYANYWIFAIIGGIFVLLVIIFFGVIIYLNMKKE